MEFQKQVQANFTQIQQFLNHKSQYKGEYGRVGIIGGSRAYTGPPYYSMISAMRCGADLSYVICFKGSELPIKMLSPDIIVHPMLPIEVKEEEKKFREIVKKLDCVLIGSGLGRENLSQEQFTKILKLLKNKKVVCDADFFYHYYQNLEENKKVISNFKEIIFTPNLHEFENLFEKIFKRKFSEQEFDMFINCSQASDYKILKLSNDQLPKDLQLFNNYYQGLPFTLLIKYKKDLINTNNSSYLLNHSSSLKRCGGLGDILGGILTQTINLCDKINIDILFGVILASLCCQQASFDAYLAKQFGLMASDVLEQITSSMNKIFQAYCK